jgi:hypothetical protein
MRRGGIRPNDDSHLDKASVLQLICEWVVHSVTIPQEQIKAFGRCEAGTLAAA